VSALGAGVFAPAVVGGFLYDDVHVVIDNRSLRALGQIRTVLAHDPTRPLLNLTFALNYALSGLRPWSYHLVNVLLHAANAALAAALFLWIARRCGAANPRRWALVSAALFAVTPMAVETAAYVSSRSTLLASFFVLAALLLALPSLEGRASPRRLGGALAVFGMGLASKEEAASLPVYLLVLDLFFVAGQRPREVARRYRIHAPFLALPALGLLARRAVTDRWLPPPSVESWRYLLTQAAAFPGYFLRALIPVDPAFYRGVPAATWPPGTATVVGLLACGALLGAAAFLWRRYSLLAFAVAWLAAGLLPSSSLVPLKEMVVDHRAYLGGAGALLLLGSWIVVVPRWRVVALVLVSLLAARSIHYEWVLADPVRAWGDAVRRASASAEAHMGLGEAYAARADPRAERELVRSVTLDGRSPRGWANLGALYAESGRMAEAERVMREATARAPSDARLHDNLGLILQALGREDDAALEWEAAVRSRPPLAQPRVRLAAVLISRGDKERARALLEEALRLEYDEEDARAIEALWDRLR
jgi:Flp pilus assembly protein TadD